jgi:SAM-dependent methyltransferase
MHPADRLDAAAEKAYYKTHNNDVNDPRYRAFVSPITAAVQRDFDKKTGIGLDFGAGSGPVIAEVLGEAGYSMRLYDPFFHDTPEVLEQTYHFIACCEVMEHFFAPDAEFALLKKLLKTGGKLYCMTVLHDRNINFEKWYYRTDPTHVFFYEKTTLEWIKTTFGFKSVEVFGRLIVFEG